MQIDALASLKETLAISHNNPESRPTYYPLWDHN